MVYPNIRRPSPAAYSMIFIARRTSPRASAIGFPSSVVMAVAISSARRPMISSALNSSAARPGAGVSAQTGQCLAGRRNSPSGVLGVGRLELPYKLVLVRWVVDRVGASRDRLHPLSADVVPVRGHSITSYVLSSPVLPGTTW